MVLGTLEGAIWNLDIIDIVIIITFLSGFVYLFWALSHSNSYNRDREVHLWEQIVCTLQAAGECCAFITLHT